MKRIWNVLAVVSTLLIIGLSGCTSAGTLDQQIAGLEQQFVEGGGYSEQLAAARLEKRKKDRTDQADRSDGTEKEKPSCPLCKGLMVLRTAKKGNNAGSQFWGCAGYPKCKGVRGLDGSVGSDRGKA